MDVLVSLRLDLTKEKGTYQSAHLISYSLLGAGLSGVHPLSSQIRLRWTGGEIFKLFCCKQNAGTMLCCLIGGLLNSNRAPHSAGRELSVHRIDTFRPSFDPDVYCCTL